MNDRERWEKEKKERQSILKHDFAAEIEGRDVTDKEADRIIYAELEDEDDDEYLVDGALLTCTSAKWEDFELSDGSKVHIDGMEEKKKEGEPNGILRVWENPLIASTNGDFRYATVADAVKYQNISPFLCNCKESANGEREQKIKENMAECRKHGVCQYLMDLEEKWDNINFGNEYKPFFNICIEPAIGSAQFVGSHKIVSKEKKEGIIMTSVLFCKHGGFIYPLTSGQISDTSEEPILDQFDPDSIKRYMWHFFRNAGFSEIAVAGLLGNVQVESEGFNREAIGINNKYFGLFQYGNGRDKFFMDASLEWAKEHGIPEKEGWKDVRFQCEYALEDYYYGHNGEKGWLSKGVLREDGSVLVGSKDMFENTTSVTDATLAWGVSYERCVDSVAWLDMDGVEVRVASEIQGQPQRLEAAQKIYDEFCGIE